MFTLFMREIKAILLYVVFPLLIAVLIAANIVTRMILENNITIGIPSMYYKGQWYLLFFLPFISAGIGAAQVYSDRNKGISTFLATMATTRWQILSARIAAGLLWIAIVFAPLVLVDIVLLIVYPQLVPIDSKFLWQTFAMAFLVNVATYCTGLLMGWNTRKYLPILGSLVLCLPLIALIVIKGFGVPMLLIGGGGYTLRNIPRCWAYETAILCGREKEITNGIIVIYNL